MKNLFRPKTKPPREAIKALTLVAPYMKDRAIRTLRNDKDSAAPGLFIRAKPHPNIPGLWYSHVSESGDVEVQGTREEGIIVFVPRALRVGEGVLVEKVLSTGRSAKGHPIPLPQGFICPAEADLSNLPKKV